MPARVPAHTKQQILDLVDDAVRGGGSHRWACSVLGVSDDRAHRRRRRLRDTGALADRAPGGVALHALRPSEIEEILDICEQWGPVDRSHRKLAHRSSHEGRVWVSASTGRGGGRRGGPRRAPMRAGCGCLRPRCGASWPLRG